jgi:protein associated with RNAse G/E|tara:strand:- start:24 stop:209 length:186 start_codon:yes stop_codon:yes gene_type:complete
MDKEEPNKIVGVDAFRERKAEQLIQKYEYGRIDVEEFMIAMLRLGYPKEVAEVIIESVEGD